MTAFDRELLEALVAEGWLRCQRHPGADLWIYNYTEKTQYENHWTHETLNCRGLILAEDGQVVARPFPKFFNYGTPQVPVLPAEPYRVTEKIDGSLGILYYLNGEPCIATRGSFTSEQAKVGTEIIRDREIGELRDATALFEIVYPENRIVVDYGPMRDLVLLGAICNVTAMDLGPLTYSGPVAEDWGQVEMADLLASEGPNREGFVLSFESGLRVKVKFAEYVRLHKIVTGVNARMIWEILAGGGKLDDMLVDLPDEIYAWIEKTEADLRMAYGYAEMRCRAVFDDRPDTDDRKALAAYFLASDADPAVLFRMLDGKDYESLIWKSLKPAGLVVPPAGSSAYTNPEEAP
jgi:RNA ligase